MSSYIHFTEEQKERAAAVDLRSEEHTSELQSQR